LSSVPEAEVSPSTLGFLPRLVGIIRRPRTTFRAVAVSPRWVGLVVVLAVVTAASQALLFQTEVGRVALVDQWERTALAFGQQVDDTRYAEFQALSGIGPLYGVATALVGGPVLTLGLAGIIALVFRLRGDRAVSFSKVLAVVAHASVILAIRQLVSVPVSYAREATGGATSLGRWFPALDAASFVGRFVGALDIFVLWWVVLLAIGVGILYGRQARSVAAAFLGVYAGLALLLAAAMTALGGTA
jgi:Yip1-like protein